MKYVLNLISISKIKSKVFKTYIGIWCLKIKTLKLNITQRGVEDWTPWRRSETSRTQYTSSSPWNRRFKRWVSLKVWEWKRPFPPPLLMFPFPDRITHLRDRSYTLGIRSRTRANGRFNRLWTSRYWLANVIARFMIEMIWGK